MSNDLLSFTKGISGIDLINYIINFMDHNMIIYNIFRNNNPNIEIINNDNTGLTYKVTNLTIQEISEIKNNTSDEQDIFIYDTSYRVSFVVPDNSYILISIK